MSEQRFWDAVQGMLEVLRDAYRDEKQGDPETTGRFSEMAVPDFLDALGKSDEQTRAAATWVLGALRGLVLAGGGTGAIPDLLEALRHQEDGVRRTAARTLGWLGHESAMSALKSALSDKESSVRREAAEALGKIGGRRPIAEEIVPGLIGTLSDTDPAVRYASTWALGRIGEVDTVPELVKRLKDEERDVRRAAARSLGWVEDKAAVPGLIEALGDESSGVRRDAAAALGKIGDAAAVPRLLKALDDEHDKVRYSAAWALGQTGDTSAVPSLLRTLHDSNHDVCRAAAEALGRLGDERAVPALHEALHKARAAGDDSQIYAIGVVLYELLTASMPIEAREFGPLTSRIIDPSTEVGMEVGKLINGRQGPAAEVVRRIEALIERERQSPPADPSRADTVVRDAGDARPFRLVTARGESLVGAGADVVIGRSRRGESDRPDIDLSVLDLKEIRTVSRRHCRVFLRGADYFIEDLDSMNGTRLNDEVLEVGRAYHLQNGDRIMIGRVMLTFEI